MAQVIVLGGGLSGLSAAHTALEAGLKVVVIDKSSFLGGNSTKATSGVNGAGTRTQAKLGITDSKEVFLEDTVRSATGVKTGPCPPAYDLGRVLTYNSADAVHWVQDKFGLALDKVSRLGGHSNPRTHRSGAGTQFPGMEITYALMQKYEQIAEKEPHRARLIVKARAHKLLQDASGAVIGVEYEHEGKNHQEHGVVVIATGGYAAGGLTKGSMLNKYRPDLMELPTTNGTHCTGDGITMGMEIGGAGVDLEWVQVHPTGLVHRDMPNERVKFLAAEALRGVGGLLLDQNGQRFCNELGTRDYVSGEMFKNKGPFYLLLNSKSYEQILWHCKHYTGRRVMQFFNNGNEMAKDMKISPATLKATFDKYNDAPKKGCPFGRKFFEAMPWTVEDTFYCAIVTPVVHYSMGGIGINEHGAVIKENKEVIPGLFAAGEVTGGVHGKNRLGGSALLECLVYGRVSGASAAQYAKTVGPRAGSSSSAVTITVPQNNGSVITITVSGSGVSTSGAAASAPAPAAAAPAAKADAAPAKAAEKSGDLPTFTLEQVAQHKTDKDCWVAVNGLVLNVTEFLDDHPGGKMAIMTFAGRDATEEFNMVHDKNVIDKYAKQFIVGKLAAKSKL